MTSQLEQTGRHIVVGTWVCAGIVMAGSATNAVVAYGALGDNRLLGLTTGLGVDIGLCVALIGDRQLHTHGLSSHWGRALRVTTLGMSLVLNVSIALRDGRYLSALMHAFLPVLLLILTEYGADVLLKFTTLARSQETTNQPAVAPVAASLPQLHRPLAPPPVATEPIPAVQPIPNRHHQQKPAWTPTRTSTWLPASTTMVGSSASESPLSSGGGVSAPGCVSLFTAASTAPSSTRTPAPRVPEPSPTPKPAPAVAGGDLTTRVRTLLAEVHGPIPGRRAIARRLGITEHAARVALDQLVTTGHGRAKSTGNGQVRR